VLARCELERNNEAVFLLVAINIEQLRSTAFAI
jgi:hypothetical protein